jgi:hypothetical protein
MAKSYNLKRISFLIPVSVVLIIADHASAQLTKQDKQSIATTIATEINRAVDKHREIVDLREKVIRRLAECAFMFGAMSRNPEVATRNAEERQRVADVAEISIEVATRITDGWGGIDRYKTIVDLAASSVKEMGARQDEIELRLFLQSCRLFNQPKSTKEIEDALLELHF